MAPVISVVTTRRGTCCTPKTSLKGRTRIGRMSGEQRRMECLTKYPFYLITFMISYRIITAVSGPTTWWKRGELMGKYHYLMWDNQVTRGYNIVADWWAGAYNPLPHPVTHTRTPNRSSSNLHFLLFDWIILDVKTGRQTNGRIDRCMDIGSFRVATLRIKHSKNRSVINLWISRGTYVLGLGIESVFFFRGS